MKSHESKGLIYTLCFLTIAVTAAICVPNILQKYENSRVVVPDFQQEQSYPCVGNICQGQNFRHENLKSKEPAVGSHQIGYPKCVGQASCDRAKLDNMYVDHALPDDLLANMYVGGTERLPSDAAVPLLTSQKAGHGRLLPWALNVIASAVLWFLLAGEFLELFVPPEKFTKKGAPNSFEEDRSVFAAICFLLVAIVLPVTTSLLMGVAVIAFAVPCFVGRKAKAETTKPVSLLEIVEQIVHDERLVPSDREELAERIAEYKKVDAEIPQIDQSIVVNRLKLQDAEMLLQKGRASLEKVESITRKSASDELLIRNYHQQIEGLESGNELLAERIQCQECLHQQKVVRRAELVEFFQDKAMQAESFDEYDAFVAEQIKFLKQLEPMAQQPVETVAPLADELKIS